MKVNILKTTSLLLAILSLTTGLSRAMEPEDTQHALNTWKHANVEAKAGKDEEIEQTMAKLFKVPVAHVAQLSHKQKKVAERWIELGSPELTSARLNGALRLVTLEENGFTRPQLDAAAHLIDMGYWGFTPEQLGAVERVISSGQMEFSRIQWHIFLKLVSPGYPPFDVSKLSDQLTALQRVQVLLEYEGFVSKGDFIYRLSADYLYNPQFKAAERLVALGDTQFSYEQLEIATRLWELGEKDFTPVQLSIAARLVGIGYQNYTGNQFRAAERLMDLRGHINFSFTEVKATENLVKFWNRGFNLEETVFEEFISFERFKAAVRLVTIGYQNFTFNQLMEQVQAEKTRHEWAQHEGLPDCQWLSLKEYLEEMKEHGKKSILVVGCGHIQHGQEKIPGKHWHRDSWCVEINNTEDFDPCERQMRKQQQYKPARTPVAQKPFVEETWANAELDITTANFPADYKGVFDVVILERIWDTALKEPYTLYNASQALKVGGELLVDVHHTYQLSTAFHHYPYYSRIEGFGGLDRYIDSKKTPDDYSNSPENIQRYYQKEPDLLQIIKTYGNLIETTYAKNQDFMSVWAEPPPAVLLEAEYVKKCCYYHNSDRILPKGDIDWQFLSMSEYLCVGLFFTDPIFVEGKVFPYNDRKDSHFLSVTKTEITQALQPWWLKKLKFSIESQV